MSTSQHPPRLLKSQQKPKPFHRNMVENTKRFFTNTAKLCKNLLINPDYFWISGCLFILAEIIVCYLAIHKVAYTEIDWKAYMQQVESFVTGIIDYPLLEGDTGPLVYPAGHLYLYTGLYYVTDHGTNIRRAQYIFGFLYLVTLVIVFRIYQKCKIVPPYVLIFMCATAYRIHSIYMLRLFNDPIAMTLFYAATLLWLNDKWTFGCIVYSLAVSVKMNILLFAPGLLVLLIAREGYVRTSMHLWNCAIIQILLGAPFLLRNPFGYISCAFNLGRIFMFKWTVNWRFLSPELFINKYFHIALLGAHLLALFIFAFKIWFRKRNGLMSVLKSNENVYLKPNEIVFTLFTSNFIGIMFSRTLHYQFYVWYFHTLPFLLWSSDRLSVITKLAILGVIEFCWNTYPSTNFSSAALHCCHLLLFISLWRSEKRKVTVSEKFE